MVASSNATVPTACSSAPRGPAVAAADSEPRSVGTASSSGQPAAATAVVAGKTTARQVVDPVLSEPETARTGPDSQPAAAAECDGASDANTVVTQLSEPTSCHGRPQAQPDDGKNERNAPASGSSSSTTSSSDVEEELKPLPLATQVGVCTPGGALPPPAFLCSVAADRGKVAQKSYQEVRDNVVARVGLSFSFVRISAVVSVSAGARLLAGRRSGGWPVGRTGGRLARKRGPLRCCADPQALLCWLPNGLQEQGGASHQCDSWGVVSIGEHDQMPQGPAALLDLQARRRRLARWARASVQTGATGSAFNRLEKAKQSVAR